MRKKILLLTNELNSLNGWATVGYELCRYLNKRFDVVIFTHKQAKNEAICENIFPVLPDPKGNLILSFLKIFCTPPIGKVDLIICNIERLLPLAVLLKLRLKSKIIVIGHGTYIYYPFVTSSKRIFSNFLSRFIDLLVVPSKYTKNKVKEFYEGDVEVINWGVSSERYFPVQHVKKEQAFIFVGELKKRKGAQYLLKAFEKLIRDFPDSKLFIIGKTNMYRKSLSELKILKNVIFTGEISHSELLNYYSKSIAHVLPAISTENSFEGFGLVHLEANACGIPTIGSFNCGNEDAIIDGVTGFLCPQKDIDCIYQKMKVLLTDDELREKMGRQALEYAQKHTWEVVGEKFVKVIENL